MDQDDDEQVSSSSSAVCIETDQEHHDDDDAYFPQPNDHEDASTATADNNNDDVVDSIIHESTTTTSLSTTRTRSENERIQQQQTTQVHGMSNNYLNLHLDEARIKAQELRQIGKDLHDGGQWQRAAEHFHQASLLLEPHIVHDDNTTTTTTDDDATQLFVLQQEYATCRLHEALCRLKCHDYEASIGACTAVLDREPQAAAIRAKALYRRARAKLGLLEQQQQKQSLQQSSSSSSSSHHDSSGALQDARQAAFLGDRKAVALYGKLMRQQQQDSSSSSLTSEDLSSLPSMQDLFQTGAAAATGSNPFLPTGDASSSSSSLLESLLNKSSETGTASSSPASARNMFRNSGNNNNGGSLAKSVLSSLSKTVENPSTQERLCRYLQTTSASQVQQMASMIGLPLSEGQASKVVNVCQGVTPRGIQRSLRTTKRLWYVICLFRKVAQILRKYRLVFILWALSIWIKSAVYRPIPINKRAAARLAMKQAAR